MIFPEGTAVVLNAEAERMSGGAFLAGTKGIITHHVITHPKNPHFYWIDLEGRHPQGLFSDTEFTVDAPA